MRGSACDQSLGATSLYVSSLNTMSHAWTSTYFSVKNVISICVFLNLNKLQSIVFCLAVAGGVQDHPSPPQFEPCFLRFDFVEIWMATTPLKMLVKWRIGLINNSTALYKDKSQTLAKNLISCSCGDLLFCPLLAITSETKPTHAMNSQATVRPEDLIQESCFVYRDERWIPAQNPRTSATSWEIYKQIVSPWRRSPVLCPSIPWEDNHHTSQSNSSFDSMSVKAHACSHLLTECPLISRKRKRSWALSRSLTFSLAVSVS